jgi:hypothetical protein
MNSAAPLELPGSPVRATLTDRAAIESMRSRFNPQMVASPVTLVEVQGGRARHRGAPRQEIDGVGRAKAHFREQVGLPTDWVGCDLRPSLVAGADSDDRDRRRSREGLRPLARGGVSRKPPNRSSAPNAAVSPSTARALLRRRSGGHVFGGRRAPRLAFGLGEPTTVGDVRTAVASTTAQPPAGTRVRPARC